MDQNTKNVISGIFSPNPNNPFQDSYLRADVIFTAWREQVKDLTVTSKEDQIVIKKIANAIKNTISNKTPELFKINLVSELKYHGKNGVWEQIGVHLQQLWNIKTLAIVGAALYGVKLAVTSYKNSNQEMV